jgi:alkanesulfonate monooxygenase SsuD/methylene tetrahydromethanopterin reductase-like flavin-dependent oxidoreductase (luciferase family)
LGGESKHTLRRVMEFCDGWFPRGRGDFDPERDMGRLRAAAEEAGRDIKSVSTTLFGGQPERAYLDRCRAAGMDRVLLALPSEGAGTILPLLDKHTALLA